MKSVTKRHLSSAACILIFLSFLLNGCQNTALSDPVQVTGYKLNTYVAVSAYTTGGHKTSELKEILNEALRICDTYELMFSRTMYKLNDGQITTVPHELGELISYGIQYADMSDGAFDITIGSVSSLWDFTSDNPAVPDDSDIQNALSYVDYTRLKLTENNDGTYTVYKPDKTVTFARLADKRPSEGWDEGEAPSPAPTSKPAPAASQTAKKPSFDLNVLLG